jgi:hypothetical protein
MESISVCQSTSSNLTQKNKPVATQGSKTKPMALNNYLKYSSGIGVTESVVG